MSGAKLAVEATSVGRRFGRRWALAHVDLAIEPGEALLVAGANGSGKTTLMRVLAGLLRPTQGTVRIFGFDPDKQRRSVRERLSLASHDGYLYGDLTALESLQLWSDLLGANRSASELCAMLAHVGLEEARDQRVRTFSAGMKKRLSLARCQLEASPLLLLDEPFAALDVEGRSLVDHWIREVNGNGATVVVASHLLTEAAGFCRRALLLARGQIVWTGPAEDLPAQYLRSSTQ